VTRLATPSDHRYLADVLARAFWDDPIMMWLVPHERTRYRRLKTFFAIELAMYGRHNLVYTTTDLSSAALWARPNQWRTPPADVLRSSPRLLSAFGIKAITGLGFLQNMEKAHPAEEHWYLGIVGADPARQGTGAGRAVIDIALEHCDEIGLGAYLESSKHSNVPYYERFGFQVTSELSREGWPTVWPMWRDPR
jgi:ribosomal protein S18 acetylase RimI-like enzyme